MKFSDLCWPVRVEEFLTQILSRQPHLFPGQDDRFADLLPWHELNKILQRQRFEATRLQLGKDGQTIDADVYNPEVMTYPEYEPLSALRHRRLDQAFLQEQLRDGATLRIAGIDELYEPIDRLAASIEQTVRERVFVDAFVANGATRGFKKHWDDSEVIAVQLSGRKRWKIWEPTRFRPDHRDYGKLPVPNGEPQEYIVTAGDVLHVPKGWWHLVAPDDSTSLHLTFTFIPRTGRDYFVWAIDEFRNQHDLLRQDLRRGADRRSQYDHVSDLANAFAEYLSDPDFMQRFFYAHESSQPVRRGFSLPLSVTEEILPGDDKATIAWLAPLAVIEKTGSDVIVSAAGKRYVFAAYAANILEILLDCQSHPLIELLTADGVEREGDSKVRELLRQLAADGLVSVSRP